MNLNPWYVLREAWIEICLFTLCIWRQVVICEPHSESVLTFAASRGDVELLQYVTDCQQPLPWCVLGSALPCNHTLFVVTLEDMPHQQTFNKFWWTCWDRECSTAPYHKQMTSPLPQVLVAAYLSQGYQSRNIDGQNTTHIRLWKWQQKMCRGAWQNLIFGRLQLYHLASK